MSLPNEIVLHNIFAYLDRCSIFSCRNVCSQWRTLYLSIQDDILDITLPDMLNTCDASLLKVKIDLEGNHHIFDWMLNTGLDELFENKHGYMLNILIQHPHSYHIHVTGLYAHIRRVIPLIAHLRSYCANTSCNMILLFHC
jgi:hypothetical protein